MKKMLKYSILITFAMLVCSLIFLFYPFDLKRIPKFNYENIEGKQVSNFSYSKLTPLIIVYFSTSCDDCAKEIYKLENDSKYQKYSIYYVTSDSKLSFRDFVRRNNLKFKNISNILFDVKQTFQFDFSLGIYLTYPTIIFFNAFGDVERIVNEV